MATQTTIGAVNGVLGVGDRCFYKGREWTVYQIINSEIAVLIDHNKNTTTANIKSIVKYEDIVLFGDFNRGGIIIKGNSTDKNEHTPFPYSFSGRFGSNVVWM